MSCVYIHTRKDNNEVFYVGIGKTEKRAYSKFNRNKHWLNIINKVDYNVLILKSNISWVDACLEEERLITLYGRIDLNSGTLVNLTNGGEGKINFIVTDDIKKKMSKAQKGRIITVEHRDKISKSMKGRIPVNKGKKLTDIELEKFNKLYYKPILQYKLNGEFIKEYPSAKIASKDVNILRTSINNCCYGRSKSAGGFKWVFKTN